MGLYRPILETGHTPPPKKAPSERGLGV